MGLIRWFRQRPSSEDIREELESHVAMRAEADGTDSGAARRRFGNVVRTGEDIRRVWIAGFWDMVAQDARYTLRSWRRSPGFALAAVLVLALGLGSATALFSAVDRILFRSLPYADADRLISIGIPFPRPDGTTGPAILLDRPYVDAWGEPPEPLESVTTTAGGGTCDINEGQPERVTCRLAEYNLLRVLGVQVVVGRDFTADDGLRGAPPAALISHRLWTRRFAADRDIVGRPLRIDVEPVTVVGVLPPDFEMPVGSGADILRPLRMRPVDPDTNQSLILQGIGRLKPGVAVETVEALLQPQAEGMLDMFPPAAREITGIRVQPLRDFQVGEAASEVAWLLVAVTAVLLLIVCADVTNLMLARVASRNREYALRTALGSPKSRLARLALTESLLLALVAGTVGLGIASVLLDTFVGLAPAGIPKIDQASLDFRVFVVAGLLTLTAGVVVGIWPAVSVRHHDMVQRSRAATSTRPKLRLALVSAQIALTLTMLGSSAVLVRSLVRQVQVPLGFSSDRVLTMALNLNEARYPTPEVQAAFFEQLLDRVREIPLVETAALNAAGGPRDFTLFIASTNIEVRDRPPDPNAMRGPDIRVRDATPGYFETFRIPIASGRSFSEADRRAAEPAVVLSESLERFLFPGEDGVGQRIRFRPEDAWHVIVGVAGDVRNQGLAEEPQPELYVVRSEGVDPFSGRDVAHLAVRTSGTVDDTAAFLRQAVADLDPDLPVTVERLDQEVAALTERPRFVAWLSSAFSGFALLVAAAGLYGVAMYLVTERTRDIGVRRALGATGFDVSKHLFTEAGRWIAAGTGLGLLLLWSTSRMFESQLFGIAPNDGLAIGGALVVLLIALTAALSIPASRAARVDPMTALRDE